VKSQIFIKLKEMKNLIITSILAVLIASATTVRAQDYPEEYLGLPGDNLNLYAVMDLFRNSETLEGFERSLNDPKSRINNLDLNRDNFVDYITVSDYIDRKVHTIVLRAVLGRKEYQDVAVFTVQKVGKKKVMIQLIGDEALYGRNYIIEPVYADKFRHGYYGDQMYADNVTIINNYYYDTYEWPMIVYIYHPHYHGWHSSWYWGYYPAYWDPWRPYYWDYYYGYHSCWNHHYSTYYQHWNYPRYDRYHDFYYRGIRQQSDQVHHRIAEGNYTETYSRPELRRVGADLYTTTHETRNSESRRAAAENQGVERRREEVRASESRDVERRAAESRTSETRAAEVKAAEARDVERRAAESRTAETRAAEVKAAEARNVEARDAERRSVESRASEARAAEAREAQSRASEARAAEARETERKSAESRQAEVKAAETRRSSGNTSSANGPSRPDRRQ